MAKLTRELESEAGNKNANPVYCTACYRRCLLYYTALSTVPDEYLIPTEYGFPEDCPLPNEQ